MSDKQVTMRLPVDLLDVIERVCPRPGLRTQFVAAAIAEKLKGMPEWRPGAQAKRYRSTVEELGPA